MEQDLILYRGHTNLIGSGPGARELGRFWALEKAGGRLQAVIDNALPPEWGNAATNLTTIKIPKGTKLFIGESSTQGGFYVGGRPQIYLPEDPKAEWIIGRESLQ